MDKINSKILNQLAVSYNLTHIRKMRDNLLVCRDLNLTKIHQLLNSLETEFENIEKQSTCDSFDLAFSKIILKQTNIKLE